MQTSSGSPKARTQRADPSHVPESGCFAAHNLASTCQLGGPFATVPGAFVHVTVEASASMEVNATLPGVVPSETHESFSVTTVAVTVPISPQFGLSPLKTLIFAEQVPPWQVVQ